MEYLGNKLIEINILDSNLVTGTPSTGAGSDFINLVTEGLASTPLATIIMVALGVASIMSALAIVLARLHHNKARSSKFSKLAKTLSKATMVLSPVTVALAVVITPILTTIAANNRHSLDSSPIVITVDKATATSASDVAILTLDKEATSHVNIYANLDTTFSDNLGTNLHVTTNNTNDSDSTINLSTTETLIYTTGPVEPGYTTDFNVEVSIAKELPVGTYKGQVEFYGEYEQIAQDFVGVTYWCWNSNPILDDGMLQDGEYIGRQVIYNLNETFILPSPSEVDLTGCKSDTGSSWRNYSKRNDTETFTYWPQGIIIGNPYKGDSATTTIVPNQFEGPQPNPSEHDWYNACWLNYWDNQTYCENNSDYQEWVTNIHNPWYRSYVADWENWIHDYRLDNNDTLPLFDGIELVWSGSDGD